MKKFIALVVAVAVLYGIFGGNSKSKTESENKNSDYTYTYTEDYTDDIDFDADTYTYTDTKQVCSACGGTGKIKRIGFAPYYGGERTDTSYEYYQVCTVCDGTGYWD